MLTVNWTNPYADAAGRWLRGNLHSHTNPASGCSILPPADLLGLYERAGYDFLAVSDHMSMIDIPATSLTLLPGIEWNSATGEHAGVYAANATVPAQAIAILEQAPLLTMMDGCDGLLVLNHPNWQLTSHYRREALLERGPYDGIEIFNGVIERLQGYAIATDKWDYLLANGRRVLGFASDDAHAPCDIALGWLMVRTADESPAGILRALQCGHFYASSGLTIDEVVREDAVVRVAATGAQEIRAIGDGGICYARARGRRLSFSFADIPADYIRFTLYGEGAAMAWTQPFFREG